MSARLAQALADRRAHLDKRRLLDPRAPERERLLPRWTWPLLVVLLAVHALGLWKWFGLAVFCALATLALFLIIDAASAAKRDRP